MAKRLQLSGKVFGRLTVVKEGHSTSVGTSWLCLCFCGKEHTVRGANLISGSVTSCGCYAKEALARGREKALKTVITHGAFINGANPASYSSWHAMMHRCYDPKNYKFHNHGGRGITVCERWKDYLNFKEDMGEPTEGLSLERIDNDGNYEPSNCKWATRKEQGRNKRNNRLLTYKGETKCMAEWCEIFNINFSTLDSRLRYSKWSVEKALTTPVRKN